MLNTFPDLLTYSFFAPTILRVGIAIVFFWGAYMQFSRLEELSDLKLPLVGRAPWAIWLSVAAHVAVGLMLLLGYYTQIAAIAGMLGGLKGVVYAKKYPRLFPLCRLEYAFVILICLSLLLSGAGALAKDLPL